MFKADAKHIFYLTIVDRPLTVHQPEFFSE